MHKIQISEAIINRVLSRRNSLHVFNEVNVSRTAHIVVDMQNGFLASGQPAEIPTARDIVGNVNCISVAVRKAGGIVVFLQNAIDAEEKASWSNWFDSMSGHKRSATMQTAFTEGSFGYQLWPGIDVQQTDIVVKKKRYSAFVQGSSNLHEVLQNQKIDTRIITGTATNVCCESTARDAMMMNYKVIFVSDGTATFTDEEHNATLGIMLAHFADVKTTHEVLETISGRLDQTAQYSSGAVQCG
jgi:ureidoacrylate peracid hydrolase